MTLGKQLTAERKKQGLSAEALSLACGVSRSYITLIENGRRLPSSKVIPKIASALNLKTVTVLDWYLEDLTEKLYKSLKIKG